MKQLLNMSKKFRKPRPSPPHWYWWDSDNCWCCNNRNNCSGCKRLKMVKAIENERRRKKEKARRDKEQFDD